MNLNIPIVITEENNLYYACSPDLNNFDFYTTYADNIEEALKNITEIIVLDLNDYKNENIEFPKYSNLKDKLNKNQFIVYLNFDLDYELAKIKQVLKNKTLVIPVWLDILASQQKINFSQLLQKALKKELQL